MGMDSMLIIYKKDNKRETVSCDRWYNILNEYTTDLNDVEEKIKYEKNTVKWYFNILTESLSWYNSHSDHSYNLSYIETILEKLKRYSRDDTVRFVMDYMNDEEYWELQEENKAEAIKDKKKDKVVDNQIYDYYIIVKEVITTDRGHGYYIDDTHYVINDEFSGLYEDKNDAEIAIENHDSYNTYKVIGFNKNKKDKCVYESLNEEE